MLSPSHKLVITLSSCTHHHKIPRNPTPIAPGRTTRDKRQETRTRKTFKKADPSEEEKKKKKKKKKKRILTHNPHSLIITTR